MQSLRNEIIMMNSVINRPDYDISSSDKSHFAGVTSYSAEVNVRLRSLIAENNEYIFHEDELMFSRPCIDYILKLTDQILLSDFEDYPQLLKKYLPFIESCSRESLWHWLDNLDSRLQNTPTAQ